MALRDYESLDEEDYYGQDFGEEGMVSVWVGRTSLEEEPPDLDILQDWCGVGFYDLDFFEGYSEPDYRDVPVEHAASKLSYRSSFRDEVVRAAHSKGLRDVKWIVAQLEFAYDPAQVKRPCDPRAVFLGSFAYHADPDDYDRADEENGAP
jgi:hypothetical protein